MIYLLSEMILELAVAVVLGMAVGWVLHRTTQSSKMHRLKQGYARRNAQLAQAQSDIGMLTDDYDDLHRKSQEQIDKLRDENKQIPSLTSNLEKSQLLVRQMMQRHEAKLRDLSTENQRLSAKLSQAEQQEHVKNQLAAKLDERRRNSTRTNTPVSAVSHDSDSEDAHSLTDPNINVTIDASETNSTGAFGAEGVGEATDTNDVSLADTAEADLKGVTDSEADTNKVASAANARHTTVTNTDHGKVLTGKETLFVAAESEDDPFDKVIEVADDWQLELEQTEDQKAVAQTNGTPTEAEDSDAADTVFDLSEVDDLGDDNAATTDLDSTLLYASDLDGTHVMPGRSASDLSAPKHILRKSASGRNSDQVLSVSTPDHANSDRTVNSNRAAVNKVIQDSSPEPSLPKNTPNPSLKERISEQSASDAQKMDAFINASEQNNGVLTAPMGIDDLPLDGSGDAAQLFEPVDQHDDLQQIFGIGPLTEKALNELGITSYSQLAELKQHDVQRIADALEIGQGRIERDNWVGNARRQLEEVLEQL